jgi:hypothetical protein
MVEGNARDFGESDGEQREIDTVNAEPKSQHANRGPGHGGK